MLDTRNISKGNSEGSEQFLSSSTCKDSSINSRGEVDKLQLDSDVRTLVGCPHGVMVKALDCEMLLSEFELQLCYYIYFRTNTLEKVMNPLILPAMG